MDYMSYQPGPTIEGAIRELNHVQTPIMLGRLNPPANLIERVQMEIQDSIQLAVNIVANEVNPPSLGSETGWHVRNKRKCIGIANDILDSKILKMKQTIPGTQLIEQKFREKPFGYPSSERVTNFLAGNKRKRKTKRKTKRKLKSKKKTKRV